MAANLLDHERHSLANRVESYALFTDLPLGRVGLTEKQAREKGHRVKVAHLEMSKVGRAIEKGETAGFMK